MTKFLNNADIKGYIAQTAVTSYLIKADSTGRFVAAIAGTDYQTPTAIAIAATLGYTPADDAAVVKLTGNQTVAGVKTFTSVVNAPTLSLNGGTLAGNNIVSMRSNPTGGQFRIEKSDGSLSAYPFYVGVDGTALAYYYNAAGALKVLLHTNDTSYFGNSLSVGYSTYASTSYMLDINGTARFVSNITAASFIKSGGTSAQFLKADGSVDSSVYLTTITNSQVTSALGYTPYNATNPNGYITSSALSAYLPLAGGTLTGDLTLSSTNPRLYFTDTDNNPDYFISNTDGTFTVYDVTNSVGRFKIYSTGNAEFAGALSGTSATFNANTSGGFAGLTLANAGTGAAQIYLNNSAQSWIVNLRTDNHFSVYNATTATTPFFINTYGLVGIGTTAPVRTFHAMGQAAFDMSTAGVVIQDSGGIAQIVSYKQTGSTYSDLHLRGAVLGVSINGSNGNVGIGLATAYYKLHVQDSTNIGTIAIGHQSYPGLIYSSAASGEFRIDNRSSAAAGYITFYPNGEASTLGSEAMRIMNSRQLRLNAYTSSTSFSGTAAGYLAFDSSGNVITVAGVAATDNTKLPLAGGTMTGTPIFTASYSNGTAPDYTDISNPAYKVQVSSGYWRVVYKGAHATVSGVYNFETGKNVYWGEPTDTGDYIFRGKTLKWANSAGTEYAVIHAGNISSYTAGSASSVAWSGVSSGTRTNYTLAFQPPTGDYAGFQFIGTNSAGAGYFLIRGTSDTDVYTAEGITLVADQGWLTLAQRTAAGKGIRFMTGVTAATRMEISNSGTVTIGGTQVVTNSGTWGINVTGSSAQVDRSLAGGSEANLVYAAIADNDFFRIRVGGASNAGWVEIATADDGTEPIYVRQYTGVFSSLTRTATLLDGSGNTSFPGTVTAPTFSGSLSGVSSQVTINYNNDSNSTYQLLWGSGNSVYGTSQVYVNPNSDVIYARGGYISPGNPWSTSDSAFFPNGITTAGSRNWIYGATFIGNAPGNGQGVDIGASGNAYFRSNVGTSSHGSSARFLEIQSANGNFIPYSFESEYGNHSWGTVARFRINQSGADRPSIQFSSASNDTRWNVGYCYADDNFRVTQNMGYRNDNSTTDGWGTERFRINTDGNTYAAIGGTLYANGNTVLHSANYSSYALPLSGGTVTGVAYFLTNNGGYLGSLDSSKLQVYSTSNNSAFMSFHKAGNYAVNFGLDADNVMRIGGWSTSANRWQLDMSGNQTIAGTYYGSGAGLTGTASSLSVGYATNANQAYSFPTSYAGGVQGNPQVYFNQSVGLKVAMTGAWSVWSDTLWVNGYAGGDVPWMCALHFLRNSEPRFAISAQPAYNSGYGSYYEVITTYNIANQTVSTANNLSGFDKTNPSFGAVYASNWFRAQGDCGLYTQDYGGHFRRNTNSYGTWESFGYNKNGWGGISVSNNYVTARMHNSSGDYGFLTENGNWWNLFYNNGNNCWGIGTDNTYSGDGFRCIKYGSAQYGWTTWSDRRAKENISSITGALDTVLAMRGVYFNYIQDEAKSKRVGFIAQELEQVLPEAVRYAEEIDEYSVEYAQIVSVLAEAIKEQNSKITRLEALVEQLTNN